MASSRPPSPTSRTESPFGLGYFSVPFERFAREESDWAGAFTLLDTMETFFDSHIDLFQRTLQKQLQKHSDRLKLKAEEALKLRELSGDALVENMEREVKNFKLKVSTRMTVLAASWQSAKVVRTREKLSFFFGVMTLLFSALMFGTDPQWIHVAYTVLGLYLLPLRAYTYKKRAWHYFLFDLCYYVTILNFIFLWVFPSSPTLFIACYCLSHGSLASAVITWRNSLVFHDSDKVTSLFVHIYAPFTFTTIRHFYPDAETRFPALREVPHLNPGKALLLSGVIYVIWQTLYWKFVLIDRRAKIRSGQRTTSFSFLLNDKRGVIGRSLSSVPEAYRELAFMAGQLVYAILTELPAVFLLYKSPFWSGVFLIAIFAVSVWNGGGFYIEVFGRKFEREMEALRKELAEASARSSGQSSPAGMDTPRTKSTDDLSDGVSPLMISTPLPMDSQDSFSSLDTTEAKKDQ
ncbi:hypothetical protein PC9H_005427 [Pleurotus ostreatus]|uniref:Glycerophosphocholine acyltransferase 1 n=2 Tax=Pleurotus ostreatus TaxID=5322 RepID=A0A8H6ZX31_PLEOS|nr:uncharacterized protein PC9H_005427 [Pleurotus ostreatus]KAF7433475.1 hypothetical protein PC9H_005427 [Pleurotus ostreatus]KAJ8697819.1 hypothetical protein PTI98_004591 [Pleurotus ostreatus]